MNVVCSFWKTITSFLRFVISNVFLCTSLAAQGSVSFTVKTLCHRNYYWGVTPTQQSNDFPSSGLKVLRDNTRTRKIVDNIVFVFLCCRVRLFEENANKSFSVFFDPWVTVTSVNLKVQSRFFIVSLNFSNGSLFVLGIPLISFFILLMKN